MYLCCVFTEQPSITVHPNGVTIREGQNMTLSCNATGNPVPIISWTRNGSPVNTSDHSRISFSDEEKQLTITNVSRTDRGEYRCVATNRVGNATSNVASVDVHCKYIHLIVWFNIWYARIFLELRSIFPSPQGARKNTSKEQNVRPYYMLNHTIRDLLFHLLCHFPVVCFSVFEMQPALLENCIDLISAREWRIQHKRNHSNALLSFRIWSRSKGRRLIVNWNVKIQV